MIKKYRSLGLEKLNKYIKRNGIKREDIIILKNDVSSISHDWYTLTYWEDIK
ncbi:hypothetical protein [Streptococcus porcinus]|uniref:Conserved domain protein n=1 Tax=Streptococcus porcinus str. Jelinkova 176 TaxID=873448 RepID=A0ABN0CV36_STRPO|nr:hypothetical protein [Streptococcus porcinus]EGJ27035.1 conserved domain protein [Streptococcus porcinus str. Jelinkova 176]SQG43972.1 Uncharacterised protein [Streptococcus porcinus]